MNKTKLQNIRKYIKNENKKAGYNTMNHLNDSLAVFASMFIPPFPPKLSYEIQVMYRPSLPDIVKFWKVFENDDEISKFL